jgi:hypothetical protein
MEITNAQIISSPRSPVFPSFDDDSLNNSSEQISTNTTAKECINQDTMEASKNQQNPLKPDSQ